MSPIYTKVAEVMQWRADLLAEGRMEDLAQEYAFPVVLYKGQERLVVQDHDAMAEVIAGVVARHRQEGVVRVEARLMALDLPRNGRFRVWLRYTNLDAGGHPLSEVSVVQYCRGTPEEGWKVEMSEYEPQGCPPKQVRARTAHRKEMPNADH